MSIRSSYIIMGKYRHLRRVRFRVTRYRTLAYGTALILTCTVGVPLALIGFAFRAVADVFEGASEEWQGWVSRFLTRPYERRMASFSKTGCSYMEHIDGPEFTITSKK